MITPGDFSVCVTRRINESDPTEWDRLGGGLPFQSARWHRFGEQVMADCPFFYITLTLDSQPLGRGTFILIRDEPLPLPPLVRSLLRPTLRRWPLLVCRSPLSNQTGLLLPEGPARQAARERILAEAEQIARQERCSFLLCDYVEAEETRQKWPAGYRSVSVADPGTCLPLDWPDFASYLAAGNKKDRQHYKRSLREAEKLGLRVERLPQPSSVEEALPLIRDVETKHGAASNPWVRSLLEHAKIAESAFLEVRRGDQLVGCGLLLYDGGVQLATALGLAEGVPYVYFSLLYESLREAFEKQVRLLRWGSGAYEVKKQLGFQIETNNYSVVQAVHPFLRPLLRLAG
jgi:predicted N-acyltransferase